MKYKYSNEKNNNNNLEIGGKDENVFGSFLMCEVVSRISNPFSHPLQQAGDAMDYSIPDPQGKLLKI